MLIEREVSLYKVVATVVVFVLFVVAISTIAILQVEAKHQSSLCDSLTIAHQRGICLKMQLVGIYYFLFFHEEEVEC